jgi:hypothetical protein
MAKGKRNGNTESSMLKRTRVNVEPISERIVWKESLVSHLRKRRKPRIGRKLRSKKSTELKQQKPKVPPNKEVVMYSRPLQLLKRCLH